MSQPFQPPGWSCHFSRFPTARPGAPPPNHPPPGGPPPRLTSRLGRGRPEPWSRPKHHSHQAATPHTKFAAAASTGTHGDAVDRCAVCTVMWHARLKHHIYGANRVRSASSGVLRRTGGVQVNLRSVFLYAYQGKPPGSSVGSHLLWSPGHRFPIKVLVS